jgi:hypothetical protein
MRRGRRTQQGGRTVLLALLEDRVGELRGLVQPIGACRTTVSVSAAATLAGAPVSSSRRDTRSLGRGLYCSSSSAAVAASGALPALSSFSIWYLSFWSSGRIFSIVARRRTSWLSGGKRET